MEILARINREDSCTVIVSLHQVDVAMRFCPRVVALNQGQVVFDGASASLTPALLQKLYGSHAAAELLAPSSQPAPPVVPAPWPVRMPEPA